MPKHEAVGSAPHMCAWPNLPATEWPDAPLFSERCGQARKRSMDSWDPCSVYQKSCTKGYVMRLKGARKRDSVCTVCCRCRQVAACPAERWCSRLRKRDDLLGWLRSTIAPPYWLLVRLKNFLSSFAQQALLLAPGTQLLRGIADDEVQATVLSKLVSARDFCSAELVCRSWCALVVLLLASVVPAPSCSTRLLLARLSRCRSRHAKRRASQCFAGSSCAPRTTSGSLLRKTSGTRGNQTHLALLGRGCGCAAQAAHLGSCSLHRTRSTLCPPASRHHPLRGNQPESPAGLRRVRRTGRACGWRARRATSSTRHLSFKYTNTLQRLGVIGCAYDAPSMLSRTLQQP